MADDFSISDDAKAFIGSVAKAGPSTDWSEALSKFDEAPESAPTEPMHEGVFKRFLKGAGLPSTEDEWKHWLPYKNKDVPWETGTLLEGLLNPQESKTAPAPVLLGGGTDSSIQRIPVVGPMFRGMAETQAKPGLANKVYSALPGVGPVGSAMGEQLSDKNYAGAAGSATNILMQMLGARKTLNPAEQDFGGFKAGDLVNPEDELGHALDTDPYNTGPIRPSGPQRRSTDPGYTGKVDVNDPSSRPQVLDAARAGKFTAKAESSEEAGGSGTANGAKSDTEMYQKAKAELGPNAGLSDVLKRAQELKDSIKTESKTIAHGQGAASVEELTRGEKFWRIKKNGQLSYQGVIPDANLGEGEALVAVKKDGSMRVQDSRMGLGNEALLAKHGPNITKAADIKPKTNGRK